MFMIWAHLTIEENSVLWSTDVQGILVKGKYIFDGTNKQAHISNTIWTVWLKYDIVGHGYYWIKITWLSNVILLNFNRSKKEIDKEQYSNNFKVPSNLSTPISCMKSDLPQVLQQQQQQSLSTPNKLG